MRSVATHNYPGGLPQFCRRNNAKRCDNIVAGATIPSVANRNSSASLNKFSLR
jgi:hypothetical protein